MALSLYQLIAIGLAVALILIPIVRWFWLRFDMPSKWVLADKKRRKEEEEEAAMWAKIDDRIAEEKSSQREFEMLRKQKQESAGRSLNEVESSDAWTKLGIHVPLNPVVKNETSDTIIEKKIQQNGQSPNAPDWELVDRMSKLSEPLEGIPHAPDLELLYEEE